MCPTTSLHVSPRCYPIVANLKRVKELNFCPFITSQIKATLSMRGKKKSVSCYVHHLVVSNSKLFTQLFFLHFLLYFHSRGRQTQLSKMSKKNSPCTKMQVLYADSLVTDMYVPTSEIRAEAWDSKLIGKVAKADKRTEGGFGKLKVSK